MYDPFACLFLPSFLKFIFTGDNCFTILSWFLLYINMNQPWVYICPLPVDPPSHLLFHHTPLACRRALGLRSLHPTTNSHWLSVLCMVMHRFQCYNSQFVPPFSVLRWHTGRDQLAKRQRNINGAPAFLIQLLQCDGYTSFVSGPGSEPGI